MNAKEAMVFLEVSLSDVFGKYDGRWSEDRQERLWAALCRLTDDQIAVLISTMEDVSRLAADEQLWYQEMGENA